MVVDDAGLQRRLVNYLRGVAPELASRVELDEGGVPLFERFGLEAGVDEGSSAPGGPAFGRLHRDRPHGGHDGHRCQHRAATRRRVSWKTPCSRPTSRPAGRWSGSCGCVTSAASS